MFKRIVIAVCVTGLCCASGTEVLAQNPFPPGRVQPDSDLPPSQAPPFNNNRQRENPRQRLEMLRVWKMTEYLELDESQAARFFPALQSMQERRYALDSTTISLHGIIRTELQEGEVNQQQVNNWRQEILNNQEQKVRIQREFMETLPEYLTAEQQAKYLIFEQQFQQILWDIIREDRERN